MPGGEHRSGRFTQLDFDSLATVADDPQAENNVAVQRPAVQPFSGTRHSFVLRPGAIQYTLDALFTREGDETTGDEDTRHDGSGHDAAQSFSGRKFSLIPGGLQHTLDALFGTGAPDEEAASSIPAERQQSDGHSPSAPPQSLFDAVEGLPSDDVPGESNRAVPDAGGRIRLSEPEPGPGNPSRDFRITEVHHIGAGGLHEKARANLAAIRLLKDIEAERRDATDDEKATLARYAGWGALAQVFEPEWKLKHEWQAAATELKGLLTEQEYASARATTPNAHFTSSLVIRAIWHGLGRLGVTGRLDVLEPAVGVGHFFGLMPEALQGGHRTGVELDGLTARIAQTLYPDATIFPQGFETTDFPDNFFDIVVGNVPFGDYPVHDPSMKRALTRAIHDYFFAKSLDKVRPGGIMALITSRYTMDKQNDVIRSHLAEQADLVGAIRLPNTAFKGNAGTEVTTDILFLQKRAKGTEGQGERWTETQVITLDETPVTVNEYYLRNPQMTLGHMALSGTMYKGKELTLAGTLTEELLEQAIAALPDGLYTPRGRGITVPKVELPSQEALSGVKDGGFAYLDGRLVVRQGNRLEATSHTMTDTLRIRGMLAIRDALSSVFATQLQDAPDEEITRARTHLNSVYDRFVQRFGYMSAAENVRAFAGDPDRPLLLSLELYDSDTKIATKAPVFARRTLERYVPVEQVDSAAAALAVSLNETGGIAWERMAGLTGLSVKQIQGELAGQVYQNPDGQRWETADEYLSGDVRAKLKAAVAAAAMDSAYRTNVEALSAVQPADILPGDIHARLGAGWIPASDVKDFIVQLLRVPEGDVTVLHAGEIATWAVALGYTARHTVSNTTTYGTRRVSAESLIEQALNMRVPTVYDVLDEANKTRVVNQAETIAAREAQQKLKDRFATWIWQDPPRAERLARLYNDTFNTIRLRTYDGSHLTLPGMNRSELRRGDLDTHQKSAVWRVLQTKNTLIGHVVGAGKTNIITAACMELKRLGLAKKPMIVVPNHLVEQWGAAFLALYPQANIFVAGKEHFQSGKREQAMARIATGSFDAVIISHKSFESLPVSDETFARFLSKEIASFADAIQEVQAEQGDSRSIIKQLEKAKKRLEEKIQGRLARERKDDGVTFEQLGIDRIFVDEADLYKNLGFATKMSRIAGLPNTESNRAMDMYMKTRDVAERVGGGVVFATGTPISNTMAELYTMQRYLAPERLEAAGVAHFDAWAANFGEAVTALELAPDGSGYRMHTRFVKFVNLPELLTMFRTFADIQTAEMLKLPKPELAGGKPEVIVSPASAQLKDYVSGLVDRAQRIRSGGVDPRVDNMLAITNDGRKAALDMRLVDAMSEPDEAAKVSKAAQTIHRIWEEGHEQRLTQAVFCDLSTPAADRFNVYDELRTKLLDAGIPEKEIAYIHHADTDQKKQALFESVNAGRVRILLGSTEKMGAGTNIQKRLVALHHLDAPWRPRDIEQRDGRILRQGNTNPQVSIFRYITEGSFDAYLYQTLETKARFIQQVMSGTVTVREAEDVEGGVLNYAEIKAIASGNPVVMDKIRIDTEVRKLDVLRAAHWNQQFDIGKQVRALPEQITRAKQYHTGLLEDIRRRNQHASQDFTIQIGQQTFVGKKSREVAAEALLKGLVAGGEEVRICGAYKGFQLVVRGGETNKLYLRGSHAYELYMNPQNPLGMLAGLETELRRLDRYAETTQDEYEHKEKALADYTEQLGRPFEQEEHLRELLARQADINHSLDLDKGDTQIVEEEKVA